MNNKPIVKAKNGYRNQMSDIQIIIKNVPKNQVTKLVFNIIANTKNKVPGAGIQVITGPKDKMAKVHHDKQNQPIIGYKSQGGQR